MNLDLCILDALLLLAGSVCLNAQSGWGEDDDAGDVAEPRPKEGHEYWEFRMPENLSLEIDPRRFDSSFLPHMLSSHPINAFAKEFLANLTARRQQMESGPKNATGPGAEPRSPSLDATFLCAALIAAAFSLLCLCLVAGHIWTSLGRAGLRRYYPREQIAIEKVV